MAINSIKAEKIFISCDDATILGSENLICNVNFPGTAQTQYNGTRNIITDATSAAGPFRLQELRNGVLIRTRNNNNQGLEVNGATDFVDNDNNWTFAEHGNDRAAFDAHWGAEIVYDYWINVHNRNSLNDAGMDIESFVHVNNNMFNAFWFNNRMYYGDGISGNDALTSLDICAHEFGHGVDQFTGNLSYEKESGALDEGFADIWGASIEAWATPAKQRWLIGEDVSGGPIRNMSNPNAFGQPDTYLGTFWQSTNGCTPNNGNDFCGVHTNSGVLNYWFFLISDGGVGTNDIGNTFNINGLGINAAAQIAYRTKLLMNNSLANYPLCREVSIQAAIQLFGNCSNEVVQVTNAWHAVGVGNIFTAPILQLSVTGFDCNNASISSNFPSGGTYNWQVNGDLLIDGISTTKNTTSNSINVTGSEGSIFVTATTGNCGTQQAGIGYDYFQKEIIGLYPEYICGDHVSVSVKPTPYAYYRWYVNNTLVKEGSDADAYCTCDYQNPDARVNGENTIRVEVETDCGILSIDGDFWMICGYNKAQSNVELFPNPARDQVTINLKQINDKQTTGQLIDIREVKIMDKLGAVKKVMKYTASTKTISINVSNLPLNIYYIEVSDGRTKVRLPLSIQK